MISYIVAAMASCVLLIPFDPVVMVSYAKESYKMKELFTAGTIVSTIWAILLALWMPLAFCIYLGGYTFMEDLFSLSMAQYTLILGMISETDFKNLPKLNTLTCAFE